MKIIIDIKKCKMVMQDKSVEFNWMMFQFKYDYNSKTSNSQSDFLCLAPILVLHSVLFPNLEITGHVRFPIQALFSRSLS